MILGIWDGHDSGACIVDKGRIAAAVNEERFTRRKLEPLFPKNSVAYCLKKLNLKQSDIENVAFSTSDFSLTLTRLFPRIKNDYWYVRKKLVKEFHPDLNRKILNGVGRLHSNKLFRLLSKKSVRKELKKIGFSDNDYNLHIVDHHMAHAASAYYTSGFNKATCVTIDGLGDGLSSTVNICQNGEIDRISASSTRDSLGLFFQEVTSILGMRILEDECKVMALSDYSSEIKKNPMLSLFRLEGTRLISTMHPNKRYNFLKKIRSNTTKEGFCYMAQKTVEEVSKQLFENALNETSANKLVWSGGVASNIKMNMAIRMIPGLKEWFVFPHMGDGGLAAGAALYISNLLFDTKPYLLDNLYLGPSFDEDEIKTEIRKKNLKYEKVKDIEKYAADLISNNKIVFWFQNEMEYGPRALGNRSILASASNFEMRDKINKAIKKRDLYQPFCPSLLEEESKKFFGDIGRPNKFMTMGYFVKERRRENTKSVVGKDYSSRPQMVGNENPRYRKLLKRVKEKTGDGILLNTSLNIHGYPMVMNPKDAMNTLLNSKGIPYLVMGDFVVTK